MYNLTAYLFQPQLWLIFGFILLLLELTDGNLILFLPMGLSAILLSLWLYLVNASLIPATWQLPLWHVVILQWAILSVICALILSNARKKRRNNPDSSDDVNDY